MCLTPYFREEDLRKFLKQTSDTKPLDSQDLKKEEIDPGKVKQPVGFGGQFHRFRGTREENIRPGNKFVTKIEL